MQTNYLEEKFNAAFPYDRYVQTGTADQRHRWQQVHTATQLKPAQQQLLASFKRPMKVLIVSGVWCGDCIQQCPLLQRCAEANPGVIDVRLLDRDEHRDLSEQLKINGGDRVPVVLFLAEDYELCAIVGDRTLHRYRALAARQLGGTCPIAIAPPDQDELADTLADWLNEFERVQLMLLLSPRLRQKHGE